VGLNRVPPQSCLLKPKALRVTGTNAGWGCPSGTKRLFEPELRPEPRTSARGSTRRGKGSLRIIRTTDGIHAVTARAVRKTLLRHAGACVTLASRKIPVRGKRLPNVTEAEG